MDVRDAMTGLVEPGRALLLYRFSNVEC